MVAFYRPGRPSIERDSFIAVKTADESVTSSTTFQDDDHLVGVPIIEDGRYAVQAHLAFDAAADGPGLKYRLVVGSAAQLSSFVTIGVDAGGTTNHQCNLTASSTTIFTRTETGFDDSLNPTIVVSGFIEANASADTTLDLQWAQNSSSGNALTLKENSWLSITRIV